MLNTDILIIGSGVVGLTLAIELKKSFTDSSITILDKESGLGFHASGRNSGVLHAGFYYTDDTLKAKLCRDGNELLTNYCHEKNLSINKCGKLVVATNNKELEQIDELLIRGKRNNVELQCIDEKQTTEIEPNAFTIDKAIFSPNTSSINPLEVLNSLYEEAKALDINFIFGSTYIKSDNKTAYTDKQKIQYEYFINTAGLYADKIAKEFGFSEYYKITPFKGYYLYSSKNNFKLRTNIYPVPNIEQPFLGTHFTITHENKIKIGPSATPAFWREQYNYLDNFNLSESIDSSFQMLKLLGKNSFNFRALAKEEILKMSKSYLAKSAAKLVKNFNPNDFDTWSKPGIRAQLINTRTNKLEMDFLYEGDNESFHVLNAVSPAFTSSFSFAKLLTNKIKERI